MKNIISKYSSQLLFILLIIFCGITVLDLFNPGSPITHDGDVHLLRLTEFYQSLQQGIVIPRWAANVNWGYGQPVFEFFYPLPSYLASLLHFFGLSFADSLKLLLGLSLVLSGATMYLWLSKLTNSFGGFVGGFLYVFTPYRFVDVYVRGDVGESLALVFVPLVLYFITILAEKHSRNAVWFGAISLSLLILCHNIVSLMTLPFIIFYGWYIWYVKAKCNKKYLLEFIILFSFGFLLSAFFWLPGLLEGKYTLRDIVTAGEYAKSFVTTQSFLYGQWSYGGTGQFTVQLGVVQWMVLIAGIVSLPLLFIKKRKIFWLVAGLILFTLIGICLMLPISNIVWGKIKLLQNFQFTWRFLLLTTFTTATLGGVLVSLVSNKWKIIFSILILLIAISTQYTYWHAKGYHNRPDTYFAGVFDGPTDTGESSPIWGIRFMESGFKNPLEVISGSAKIQNNKRTFLEHTYTVTAIKPTRLMENTLYFPGWFITVDDQQTPIEFQDQQHRGIMTFNVSPGTHMVRVYFTETKFRWVADYISLISAVVVVFFLLKNAISSIIRV